MPSITDWLMVVITTVYVIATIIICRANLKAAQASREEVLEIKRQYESDNRSRIEIEFCFLLRTFYVVRFVNHGKLTAQHVNINFDDVFIDSLPNESFRKLLYSQKNKECIIGVGQHFDIYIGSGELHNNPLMKPVTGTVTYEDGNNTYCTKIYIDLENYATFSSSSQNNPNVNELKKIKHELEKLNANIGKLITTDNESLIKKNR